MKCPECGKEIDNKQISKYLRSIPSEKRSEASRENGKKGGRPKKEKANE